MWFPWGGEEEWQWHQITIQSLCFLDESKGIKSWRISPYPNKTNYYHLPEKFSYHFVHTPWTFTEGYWKDDWRTNMILFNYQFINFARQKKANKVFASLVCAFIICNFVLLWIFAYIYREKNHQFQVFKWMSSTRPSISLFAYWHPSEMHLSAI